MTEKEQQIVVKLIQISRNMQEYIYEDTPVGKHIRQTIQEAKILLLELPEGKQLIEQSKGNLHYVFFKDENRSEEIRETTTLL